MKKISLFIYDLDGTLIDSKVDIAASVNYTMEALGLPRLPDPVIYEFVGHGVTPLIQQAVDKAGGPEAYAKAMVIFKEHYRAHLLDKTLPFEGVMNVLKYYSSRPQIILTNKSQEYADKIVDALGMRPLVQGVFGGDTQFPKKPDPKIVYHLMQQYQIIAEETVIVGDSLVDIQTGKNAGIFTCGALYGFRPRVEIETSGCDFKIESFQEIQNLFN